MNTQFTKKRLHKFLDYYRPHRNIFAVDMFFTAVSAITVLLFPLVSGYMTKEVLKGWSIPVRNHLMLAGIVLLVLTAVKIIGNMINGYYGHAMGAKMESTMRQELMEHYEKQSFHFHAQHNVGKLLTIALNDLAGMTEVFHHGPENILSSLIKFGGAFVILVNINWMLTFLVFGVLPLLYLLAVRMDRVMEQALLRNKQDLSEMNEHLEDTLSGIRTVKAFGNEALEADRFRNRNERYTKSKCNFYKVEAYFYETMGSFPQFLTMLTVFFGALFVGKGTLDLPVLVTFLLYVGSLAEPVSTLLNFMKLYEEGKAGFIRFMDMLEVEPTIVEDADVVAIGTARGEIVFDKVSFHYEDSEENVLEDISFVVHGGQSVAFAGASGIGKTTVSGLIARFFDVTEGSITIDGVDIRKIPMKCLRENIGMVQQEVYIFNGTIRDNIRYGCPDAEEDAIVRAAELANLDSFIMELRDGYDTLVGTRGIRLSGGQRQRISLARLFLKDPRILILDEATSALDYESEKLVQQSIEKLMENRTSIVIAHRLSTIKHSDVIFVLGGKKIMEQGSHWELLKQKGEYAKLCEFGSL